MQSLRDEIEKWWQENPAPAAEPALPAWKRHTQEGKER